MSDGMPQARVGDLSQGHWIGIFYFPPTALNAGASSSFSSGPAMSRVGDTADTHFAFIYGIVPFPLVKQFFPNNELHHRTWSLALSIEVHRGLSSSLNDFDQNP